MADGALPAVPTWVVKRDGRMVPFEADKISRSLFVASERLGRPDAFLARELADGVTHFLALECEEGPPTTEQLADLVVKVIRELGHPALAEAYVEGRRARTRRGADPRSFLPEPTSQKPTTAQERTTPEAVIPLALGRPISSFWSHCGRAYSLQVVFTRDLVAAHESGLLTINGLETPASLSGCVLRPRPQDRGQGAQGVLLSALEEVSHFVGDFVVVDGPEYLLTGGAILPEALALGRELALASRLVGLNVVVNLNCGSPPSWAGPTSEGPLFSSPPGHGPQGVQDQHNLPVRSDQLAQVFAQISTAKARSKPGIGVDWHLGKEDFEGDRRHRLLARIREALAGTQVGFVFDRPRRVVALSEGVNRQHPAILLSVELNLLQLVHQPGPAHAFLDETTAQRANQESPGEHSGTSLRFIHRLGSLARLALSAAVQKRHFLRQQSRYTTSTDAPSITSGFLLDRARLVVIPRGLAQVVQFFTGKSPDEGGESLELARQIIARLHTVLQREGRSSYLETCVDGPFAFPSNSELGQEGERQGTPIAQQLRAGGVLHAVAGHGTLALLLPDHPSPLPEEIADWLEQAWNQTEVVRIHLVRPRTSHRQLMLQQ